MSRTAADLVAEYWGACGRPNGRGGWCSIHEARWSDGDKFCDWFSDLYDFAVHVRTADAKAKP